MNEKLIEAVRFYEGDVSGDDPFWSDPKAYVTLNSLLFPGIENETLRSAEGKRLNGAMLEDTGRLLGIYEDLLDACSLCALKAPEKVWRVERFSDYELCRREGRTISFTSTSTAGFLGRYGDKFGLAVMAFDLPAGTPCISFAEVLPEYAKADEAEILLPPWLDLEFEERAPEGEELSVRDMKDEPPRVFVHVKAKPFGQGSLTGKIASRSSYKEEVLPDPSGAAAGQRVYACLNRKEEPDPADADAFSRWKDRLQEQVRKMVLDKFRCTDRE